jgi:YHS domain-containing protein
MTVRSLLAAVALACFLAPAAWAAPPVDLENATCPVKGTPAKPAITETYKGMTIHFCCTGCAAKFKASPETYLPTLRSDPAVAKKIDAALGASGTAPSIDRAIEGWPVAAKEAATKTAEVYGAPKETGSTQLVWVDSGPWAKTIVHREGVAVEQVLRWQVDAAKAPALAKFEHVTVRADDGEVSARHDREALNFVALNLANEIVTGKKTLEQANAAFLETEKEVKAGKSPAIAGSLQFEPTPKAEADAPK